VGGTGFYLRALFLPLFREPPLDPERRSEIRARMSGLATDDLRRWCRELDEPMAHMGRAQLMRAIEVGTLAGKRLSALQRQQQRPSHLSPRYLLVDSGTSLNDRIRGRAKAMLNAGWESEAEKLATEIPHESPAWKATGYRTVCELVRGEITREAALELITIQTRQYAKRQRTWFRHQLRDATVHSVDAAAPDLPALAAAWFKEGSRA
jgi:tRNA dimethylallyltransferase